MPYEKVSGSSRGSSAEPKISLRKSGSIGINNACLEEFFDADVDYVEVFHDKENNKMGLLPKEDEEGKTYKLTRANSGGSVTPSNFLRNNSLVPKVTTQYEPFEDQMNADITLISIDLDDPIGTYGSPDLEDEDDQSTVEDHDEE